MKRKIGSIFISSCLFLLLFGCNLGQSSEKDDEALFLFKGTKLTDKGYVGTIIRGLRSHEELKNFSLYPGEKQITIRYNNLAEKEAQRTTITNSTFIFTLVSDVEKITFRFGERRYDIYKEELNEWYNGNEYQQISSEKELRDMIRTNIDNSQKVDRFFKD